MSVYSPLVLVEENDIIMDAQDIISQSSVWFPETLTYILSNLNTCFPSVDTLKLSFPGSCDQDDNFDIFLENVTGVDLDELEEESYHHVLKKLLDMTFSAVVNNARKNLEDAALPNSGNEIASRQYIKHFSISNYPPFDCAILTSPTARAFFSQLVSFSLKLDRDYDMDDGGYYNPPHCWFLTEILPSSFLSHFYAGSSLERLRIKVLDNCCMGVAEGFPLHGERMGSLKKLVLENVIISRRTAIDNGLGSFIQANHDTLEEILLDAASWYTEQLDQQHSSDNWGAFWEFLRKNCPAGLQRLEINGSPPYGHLIARNEPSELAKTLDRRTFAFFRYVELSVGFGYVQVDEGENAIPEFRMEDDFKKWSLLRNSILGKSDNI